MVNNVLGYNGNPNLKPAYYNVEYTKENIIEYRKCHDDFFYYCENYCEILCGLDWVKFKPRDYQIKMAEDILNNKFTLGVWSRQSGKSTILAAIISWYLVFTDNYKALIAAHEHKTAIEIMSRVKDIIERLPWWLQPGIKKWNELSIELENGSELRSSATTKKTGRGFSFSFCVGGETKIKVRNKQTQKIHHISIQEFSGLIDSKNSDEPLKTDIYSRIIINKNYEIDTPYGWDDFDGISVKRGLSYKLELNDGKDIITSKDHLLMTDDNKFNTIFKIYKNNMKLKTGEYIKNIISDHECLLYDPINVYNLEHCYFSNDIVSHNCLLDEFAFVDSNIAEPFYTSIYPTIETMDMGKMVIISTPSGMNHFYKMAEDSRLQRSHFKFNGIKWDEVPGRDEAWRARTIDNIGENRFLQEYECNFLSSDTTLISGTVLSRLNYHEPVEVYYDGSLKIFEKPEEGHNYFMTVDTSRGKGIDSSAFTIIDITKYPLKVVAHYADPNISNVLFPGIINQIGRFYNEASVLVEINDNGQQVADMLFDEYEYENMMGAIVRGRAGQQLTLFGTNSKGIKTSVATKRVGCSNLKNLIEMNKLELNSFDIISELSNFVQKNNSYEADTGLHDDLVMCLVIFSWASQQNFFKNYIEMNNREIYSDQLQNVEESMLPSGYLVDGSEEESWLDFVAQ